MFSNIFFIDNTFALSEKSSYVKDIIIKKSELNKSKKGQQYAKTIDTFVEDNKNNEKKLLELNSRLEKLLYSGKLKNDTTGNTIKYLNAKVNIAILNIVENENQEILNPSITNEEKEIVKNRIYGLIVKNGWLK